MISLDEEMEKEYEIRWYCRVLLLQFVLFLRVCFGLILSLCFDATFSEVEHPKNENGDVRNMKPFL